MTGGNAGRPRAALLLVDLAESVVNHLRDGTIVEGPRILQNLKNLAAAARKGGVPVFFSLGGKRWHTSSSSSLPPGVRGSWSWRHGIDDDDPNDDAGRHNRFHTELMPSDNDVVINKIRPSAFFGTPLVSILNAYDCNQVYVAGVMTSGCIRATIVDAFSYDLRPVLVEDAVGDVVTDWHENAMDELPKKYCLTVKTAKIANNFLQETK